jgi:hypothetical protein
VTVGIGVIVGVWVAVLVGIAVRMGMLVNVGVGVYVFGSVLVGRGVSVIGATVKVGVADRAATVSIADQVRAAAVPGKPGSTLGSVAVGKRLQDSVIRTPTAMIGARRRGFFFMMPPCYALSIDKKILNDKRPLRI